MKSVIEPEPLCFDDSFVFSLFLTFVIDVHHPETCEETKVLSSRLQMIDNH